MTRAVTQAFSRSYLKQGQGLDSSPCLLPGMSWVNSSEPEALRLKQTEIFTIAPLNFLNVFSVLINSLRILFPNACTSLERDQGITFQPPFP